VARHGKGEDATPPARETPRVRNGEPSLAGFVCSAPGFGARGLDRPERVVAVRPAQARVRERDHGREPRWLPGPWSAKLR